jgi:hypothetical protein
MSIIYRFWNWQQTICIQVNSWSHHHRLRLIAKMNTLLKQSWTPKCTPANSNTWSNGLATTCWDGSLLNFIPRVKQLTDSMRSTQTNQDHYQIPHKPTLPELSASRGILLWLEFPLLLTFLISLSSYPLSLLICIAVHFMHYDIFQGFVGGCVAMLIRMFRLVC